MIATDGVGLSHSPGPTVPRRAHTTADTAYDAEAAHECRDKRDAQYEVEGGGIDHLSIVAAGLGRRVPTLVTTLVNKISAVNAAVELGCIVSNAIRAVTVT